MSYVRNAWYVGSWSDEVVAGKPHGLTILGEPIVIWRDEQGAVHAFEDRCVHRLAPLSKGRCEGANLRCMYHGLLFNAEGRVISIPGQDVIPSIARVKTYPVIEQDSWIWVWMGDPERADEALIPRVSGLDDPQWALDYGTIDYAAEARLINDNLTDFSHLAFVHAKSFASSENLAAALPSVTPIERGVSNGPRPSATPEFRTFLWNVVLNAFAEDREMIEGQQRIIDSTPDHKVMPVVADKGTVLFNRLVERMAREERQSEQATEVTTRNP